MSNFNKFFDRLIGHEGKFQNNRADRGNWTGGKVGVGLLKGTKFGISAMAYPDLDIANLTVEEVKPIYKRDYWDRFQAESYHPAIGFQTFDAGVNHGPGNAVRFLQRAAGVLDDGDMGPASLRAVKAMELNDALLRFNSERLSFMVKLSTFDEFGRGWVARVAGNMRYAADDN
jgi:lysozyme family protein